MSQAFSGYLTSFELAFNTINNNNNYCYLVNFHILFAINKWYPCLKVAIKKWEKIPLISSQWQVWILIFI